MQPYIHDAIVTIKYRRVTSIFHIFMKNHKFLRVNGIIARWANAITWRGDILVMRVGNREPFVSMRGADASLADFAVRR